ncbi:Protein tanc2, partial [Borealophlyctis nickersoniae]
MPRTRSSATQSDPVAEGSGAAKDPNPFDFTVSDDDVPLPAKKTPNSKLKNTYKSPARTSLTPRSSPRNSPGGNANANAESSDDEAPLSVRASSTRGKSVPANAKGRGAAGKAAANAKKGAKGGVKTIQVTAAMMDDEKGGEPVENGGSQSTTSSTGNGATVDSGFASQEVSPRKRPTHAIEVEVVESRLRPRKVRISDVHEEHSDKEQENEEDNEEEEEEEDEEVEDDEDEDEDESDDDTMYAEKILDERTRNGQKSYLIKWDGFSHDANEWVIAPEVDAALIAEWEKNKCKGKKRFTLKRDETYVDGEELLKMVDEDEENVEGKKKRRRSSGAGEGKRKRKKKGSEDEDDENEGEEGDAMDVDEDGGEVPKKTKSPRKRSSGGGGGGGSTRVPKPKKVAAPKIKKLSKKAQALHDAEQSRLSRISLLQSKPAPLTPTPPSDQTLPDTTCCLLCSARQFNLAASTGNNTLLENCVKETKRMCGVEFGRKPDLPHDTALTEAILKNDLRGVKVLKEGLGKVRVDAPQQYLRKEGTGYVGGRTFGHRIKTVNESRGNREGNNAFYSYTHVDPFADYVASAVATTSSSTKSRMSPGGNDWVKRSLEYCLRDARVTKEMIEYLCMEWPDVKEYLADVGVYEAVGSGNLEVGWGCVEVLERCGGFGFNHLHGESLKLKEGESFTSYRKHQILKKATGNAGITPLEMACINPDTTALAELYNALSAQETTEPDAWGRLPIHFAAGAREPAALEWLVGKGCDVRVADGFKFLPLQFAAKYGRHKNIPLLVEKTGSADYTLLKDGYTALHFASHY